MSEELKPVNCGCGGKVIVLPCFKPNLQRQYIVICLHCQTRTEYKDTEAEAITTWNKAMSGSVEEKLKAFWYGMSAEMKEERTAKVVAVDEINRHCGNCDEPVGEWEKYCSKCGARLEWE